MKHLTSILFILFALAACAAGRKFVQSGFASDYVGALDTVYQWSVEVPRVEQGKPNSRAFLWVPERCRELKGVILGSDNMLEEPIFANKKFRDALAAANVGIVFVIPGLDSMQKLGAAEKAQIAKMMDDLAKESGYDELSSVKLAAIGHSAWADFPWLMAAEWPERTLCAMSIKGSWPESNRPTPTKLIPRFRADIPLLLVNGEFEDGARRAKLAAEYFGKRPDVPFSMYIDWGRGHFDWSDRLCAALGQFVAASARGEDTRALMARLQPSRPAPGKVAVLGYRVNGEMVKQNPKSHTQIDLNIATGGLRERDLRFTMDAAFDPIVPEGRPVGWTGLVAGSAAPHPADESKIKVEVIQGPCVQTGPREFLLRLNRRGYSSYKGFEIVLQETFPGGDGFRPCVQQALLRMKKPSQPFGTKHYYVREGAATVDPDTGKVTFLPLPPKAKRPHRVTIVEWTWGGAAREIVVDYSFPAPQVRLLDSPFRDNAMRESRFMKGIDARALTRMFRVTAGLETREMDEGKYEFLKGWEEDTIELRGHTCGHWMSGMASLYELTGDEEVKARAAIVVHTLAESQKANGNGYVSAFPESDIDKIIAGTRVWAPWYVIHKIFAGLLDQYLVCENEEALAVAKGLGDWTAAKVLPLSDEQAATMRKREFGGIAESLVVLADITKDEKYLKAAEVFKENDLYKQINGKHANTLIPKVIADVRFESESRMSNVESPASLVADRMSNAMKFWNEVIEHYMYAPGCVSTKESFRGPDRQGDFLTGVTGETCCTYNLLKLSRLLWSPARADIADYQERAVWNHILGQMEPIDGHLTYFMPVMTGSYKLQSRPNDSFWCCCGSAMESHTKYQRLVCEEADGALYINNFIPSEIKWKGLLLRLETKFPSEGKARLVVVRGQESVVSSQGSVVRSQELESKVGVGERIFIRRPFWAFAAENAKSFYEVHERVWKKGDVIDIPLPCKWRTESVVSKDGAKHTAVFYGPILMAARLGIEGMRKDATRSCNYYAHDYSVPEKLRSVKFEPPETWKRLSPPPPYDRGMDGASPEVPEPFVEPTFMTPSGLVVSPYWTIHGERLCVYFASGF